MGIFRSIADLFVKKQEIEKKIAILQNSCNHHKKTVRAIRENVDSSSPVIRYVCNECSKVLGYPNDQEVNKFFRE